MTSVLGVSVGASAVRFACRDTESPHGPLFRSRSVTATLERPGDPAAASLDTVLAETDEIDEAQAIGVAYRNQAQAGAVQAAMTRLEIGHFHLVPEVTAALERLETSGDLGDHETLVFYDLGSSGLTVTVVDRPTGLVLSTARSDRISGDLLDRLIYHHHLELHRFTPPADPAAQLALTARCRDAKEQLSTHGAVCMPGEGGLLLLSQDSFDSLIDGPVKASAHLTREVIRRSGRTPDAAVLLGGGAHIPLVTSVMQSRLDLPVIVPAQPELVAAEGAALLARPATGEAGGTVMSPTTAPAPHQTSNTVDTADTRHTVETTAPPRTPRRLLLAGSVVTVVAAIGLGLGTDLLQGSERDAQPTAPPPPTTTADVAPPPDAAPPVVDTQPTIPAQTEVRTTNPPQTHSPTQTPTTPRTQNSAPADTSAPPPPPEPAPLIPGLPQYQLPTLPPPPPLPLPELPPIPGL
ncbi:Hsp70 family protein [Rhodococcus aetherivorans]|uniref:Hsp70 family protein n=1 Tax=Rhodococcus aetherivorans TaxID=191292 RepID=UPI0029492103|nr:Hsp70 family protein [Rhodococcus aetherivorans]MDV6295315.1 Hsp70 family protein [Rhodococcus aetherivorans]